jgi:uncharacterized protein
VADVNDALLALAECDESLVRARHEVTHPHSQRSLDEVNAELAELAARKLALDTEQAPLLARAGTLDTEANAARDRARQIDAKLTEATGAGRDLAAMEEERRSLADRASRLEDDQLEVLEALEPLDVTDAALREAALDATRRRDELVTTIADERSTAERHVGELSDARAGLAALVDAAVLARYEAIAARTGGSGAARLVDGRCGGCRVAVPASVADRLSHGGDADAIAVCDECGRLLVH